jgi:hypothetical protein
MLFRAIVQYTAVRYDVTPIMVSLVRVERA